MSNRNRRKNKIRDNKRKARRDAPPAQGWFGKFLDVVFFEFYLVGKIAQRGISVSGQTSWIMLMIGVMYFPLLFDNASKQLSLSIKILIGIQLLLQLIWWLRYGNDTQIELLKVRRRDRHPLMFLVIWGPIFGYPLWRLYVWY
ncbi:MAG: hypothetical protein IM638_10035 [Bacteroidetes bacterium]|nr:hypothetical protein [Bacteroidota bacterium]